VQPGALDPSEARDTTTIGPPKDPERGTAAQFNFPGQPLDTAKIVKVLATILEDADRYRRKFVAEQLKGYTQYNGIAEDQTKAEWQNRINVPLPKQAVDVSTARVIDALFSSEDWFDIYSYTRSDDAKVDTAKNMLKWQLWKSNFREPIATSIKDAFICGFGACKVTYREDLKPVTIVEFIPNPPQAIPSQDPMQPPQLIDTGGTHQFKQTMKLDKSLCFEPVVPTDLWLDPTGRNRFIIHKTKRSLSDLWALAADQTDPNTGQVVLPAVYDQTEIKKIKAGAIDSEREVQTALVRRDTPNLGDDMGVDVYEYWGDIYDPVNGAVLYRNVVATFVDKRFLIRAPQSNPYRHGMAPFIVFTPSLAPHQIYGYGLLTSASMIADAINRVYNIILDKQLLNVPAIVAYPTALRNPEEMNADKPKWTPGKVWLGKDPERPPFQPVTGFQEASEVDLQLLDRLVAMYQMATGVNEFSTGTPQTNNRKTKEEVQSRVEATTQVFNDAAQHIEQYALSPMLKMVYYLMIQFETEYDDENLLRMFPDPMQQQLIGSLKTMDAETRWKVLFLDAEFRVTGISLSITRNDRLQRLQGFLQSVISNPLLSPWIDYSEVLRQMARLTDIPPQIILPPALAMIQAQQQAQIQQMMNPQPAPGQGGGQPQQGQPQNQGGQGGPQETQNPHNTQTHLRAQSDQTMQQQQGAQQPQ
jgi:hypothetical protein